ncbi:hypothetical protein R1flu_007104 [Riccia fluitans]|uniref:Uncharacterized protein n=1 Tax=Riccia fluitans TaxID=41844 RepID=A0ABD1YY65_9MARC
MVQGAKGQTWGFSREKPVIDRSKDLDHRPRRCAVDKTVSLKGARYERLSIPGRKRSRLYIPERMESHHSNSFAQGSNCLRGVQSSGRFHDNLELAASPSSLESRFAFCSGCTRSSFRIEMGSVVSLGIFVRVVSFMISHPAPAPQGLKQFDALAISPSYVGMAPSSSPLRIGSHGHLLV